MILNRTAGGQKKYRIMNNTAISLPAEAEAGTFVIIEFSTSNFNIVGCSTGFAVPVGPHKQMYTRAGGLTGYSCFVMPAEDVTIS